MRLDDGLASSRMIQDDLLEVLADAQAAGFLGPAPLEDHIRNGLGFAATIGARHAGADVRCADLGSGGGVPALVVARARDEVRITCIDRGTKRCEFLADAITRLDLGDRILVVEGDAEDVARAAGHESRYDVVTARSFGPPAVTAEAAVRLMRLGGTLLVSEPPTAEAGTRWEFPRELAELGLSYDGLQETGDVRIAVVLRTGELVPERYPRRSATVRKRPMF